MQSQSSVILNVCNVVLWHVDNKYQINTYFILSKFFLCSDIFLPEMNWEFIPEENGKGYNVRTA